jgi:hypothetical protein
MVSCLASQICVTFSEMPQESFTVLYCLYIFHVEIADNLREDHRIPIRNHRIHIWLLKIKLNAQCSLIYEFLKKVRRMQTIYREV